MRAASIQVEVVITVPHDQPGSANVSSAVTDAATELVARPAATLTDLLGVVVLDAAPVQVSSDVSVTRHKGMKTNNEWTISLPFALSTAT